MSMVDRVAAVLDEHLGHEVRRWFERCGCTDEKARRVSLEMINDAARAVIEAMREPTDAIKEAGSGFIYEAWGDGKVIAAEAWEAMINAANLP